MGRYYNGDIEGKFWFGIQASNSASRFSASAECEPSFIEYYFDEDHLKEVQDELSEIENNLGENMQIISNFFLNKEMYNDEELVQAGISSSMLEDYADYLLGRKIEKCIIDEGQCQFQAEL